MNNGMSLYIPTEALRTAVEEFGRAFSEKLNSYYGKSRISMQDYSAMEDGRVLCTFLDTEHDDSVGFVLYHNAETLVDDEVCKFIKGEYVDLDATEQLDSVEGTLSMEEKGYE